MLRVSFAIAIAMASAGDLERRNLPLDEWLCSRCFIADSLEHGNGRILWDLPAAHSTLTTCGEGRRWIDWIKWFGTSNSSLGAAPVCDDIHVSTTSELVWFCFYCVAKSRNQLKLAMVQYVRVVFDTVARRVQAAEPIVLPADLVNLGVGLTVKRGSRVSGFHSFVNAFGGRAASAAWGKLHNDGVLDAETFSDDVSMKDCVNFVSNYGRYWKDLRKGHKLRGRQAMMLHYVQRAFVLFASVHFDAYLVEYLAQVQSQHLPVVRSKPGARKYTRVCAETVWDLMEEARECGSSLYQLCKSRKKDLHVGCSPSRTGAWVNKEKWLYNIRRLGTFERALHFNVVADGSIHSIGQDTLVSIVYSWESRGAAYGDALFITPGDVLLPGEVDLEDEVEILRRQGKLERVSTYRQMQALSYVLESISGGIVTADSFFLPDNVHASPVKENEIRIVKETEDHFVATIVAADGKSERVVLPNEIQNFYLLVPSLDQGPQGTAAEAYGRFKEMMMHCKWDKIHREIRDWRLSYKDACDGVFLKAMIYSNYIWGLNNKPQGTRTYSVLKKRVLNVFMTVETCEGNLFQKYGENIAQDIHLPWNTPADQARLFASLPALQSLESLRHSNLPYCEKWSFAAQNEAPKMGSWFSWMRTARAQIPEFHATKMLFESHVGGTVEDPEGSVVQIDDLEAATKARTPQEELRRMRSLGGGIKLAYQLMTSSMLAACKVMYVVTLMAWQWYAKQIELVKSPEDQIRYMLAQARGWKRDKCSAATVGNALHSGVSLDYLGIEDGNAGDKYAKWTLSLTTRYLSHRSWSAAVRYNCCPECFACIFSADEEESNATAASMGRVWRKIVQFENVRHEFAHVRKLLGDLNLSMPQRMVMIAFERDKFGPTSQCGRKLLRGCLETLPDNKSVEDIHLHVKNDSKRNSNRKQRAARIQDKIIHSKILEQRGIPHYAALNKQMFVRDFAAASASYGVMPHDPKRHLLSKKWSQLFKPKQWGTITEETLRLTAAAWQWLTELAVPREIPLRVDDALFTKMVTRETGRQYVGFFM
jgi:hypothetical protein